MSMIAPPRPTNALPTSVPYLPRDDHGGGSSQFDPISAAVVASLDANLGALLRMECGEFWRHIAHDVSIARALDTYLRYRRRPYDDGAVCAVAPPTTTNDDDDDAHEDLDDRLARRVFMTIRRLATIERDDPLVPTLASRATALTKLRLVDAAKILDVCALFGPDNPRPTADLVADLIAMFGEPLLDDLAAAGTAAAVDMDARADALIEDMFADDGLDPTTRDDALGYFRDVGATLTELIRAAPAIASRLDEGREVSDKCRTTQETSRTFGEMTIHECGSGGGGAGGKGKGGNDVAVAPGALAAAIDRVVNETTPTLEQMSDASANDESGTFDAESSASVRVKCAVATSALMTLLRVMRDPPVECVPGGVPGAAAVVSGYGGESFGEKEKELVLATEKIEALRGLLPDHGDGYLAAVLDAFDGNPETAAGHVFEGSLPSHLQKMDTKTTLEAYFSKKKKTAPAPVSADGKTAALKGTWATRPPVRPNVPQSAAGGFIRRKGDNRDRAGNRTWDLRMDSADQKTTLALASALEYDDEYDDSFDELAEVKGLGSAAGEVSEGIPMVPGSNPRGGATNNNTKTGGPSNKSYWISDGKVYHSRKDGATKVQAGSNEEAAAIAARMSAVEKDRVHGLGAGGNRAAFDAGAAPFVPGGGGRGGNGGRGAGGGGGGAGGDRGPPAPSTGGRHNRGGGAADHQRKKHFRKDAAAKKMSKGVGPPQ